jgi:hypothetical protein
MTPTRLRTHLIAITGAAWFACSCDDGRGESRNAETGDTQQQRAVAPCRLGARPLALRELPEASGVAVSRRNPGVLWSHNDSGEPVVFALDTLGRVRGRVRIVGAKVGDWEDVAVGPCPSGNCLYLADIGDNRASRRHVTVYRVAEPAVGDNVTSRAEAFDATYRDGANDAEALFVTADGDVFVITKGDTGPVALYRYPRPLRSGSTIRLERVATMHARPKNNERITGASASPDVHWVVLRTNDALLFFRTADLISGRFGDAQRFDLKQLREPQGEGATLSADGTVYLVGEAGGKGYPGSLAKVACALRR